MKLNICLFFIIMSVQYTLAQQNELKFYSVEVDYFSGSVIEHNPDIAHLITSHPTGFILSLNRKSYGYNEAEERYNYPDWGITFAYQDMHNRYLGEHYGLYGHFNFYFLNRNVRVGVAQGISYNTNPYDPETNFQNNAYGSHLLSTTIFKLNYSKENLFKGFGLNAGIGIIHYSNANFKAPNSSTNTFYVSAGISYLFNNINFPVLIPPGTWPSKYYAERIKYNVVFRTGRNEADVNGLGQHPFYVLSVYADKRINYKSTFQAGAEVFFSIFLRDLIRYRANSFPEDGLTGDEDYKRIGVFVGHELRFKKIGLVSQIGYYVYWPYEFENRTYLRLGLKRYFLEDKFFFEVSLKSHGAKAEAVEFGLGIKL